MKRYSIFALLSHAISGHQRWPRLWRDPDPKPRYDVVIVGAGGHGLATAYYLAKEHGITNVAVLEKGWLGGGNTGRNTTIVRSNYHLDANAHFYELSLKLWEGLSHDLNYNVMYSARGVLNLGVDAEWLDPAQVKSFCRILNVSPDARYPVLGATLQRRGGVARHDAVAWGLARAADARGVDIIQNCEVTAIRREGGRVTGVETTRGFIGAGKLAIVAAGHNSVLAGMAGVRLPIESHAVQAFVTRRVHPFDPAVVTIARVDAGSTYNVIPETATLWGTVRTFSEQTRSTVLDGLRGLSEGIEGQMAALVELFPIFSRMRMMRSWGGIVDVCPDASPIIGRLPVEGLYLNGGWGTGGFKATPGSGWVFAYTIARGEPHRLNAAFGLERFTSGGLIDEHGAAAVAH